MGHIAALLKRIVPVLSCTAVLAGSVMGKLPDGDKSKIGQRLSTDSDDAVTFEDEGASLICLKNRSGGRSTTAKGYSVTWAREDDDTILLSIKNRPLSFEVKTVKETGSLMVTSFFTDYPETSAPVADDFQRRTIADLSEAVASACDDLLLKSTPEVPSFTMPFFPGAAAPK